MGCQSVSKRGVMPSQHHVTRYLQLSAHAIVDVPQQTPGVDLQRTGVRLRNEQRIPYVRPVTSLTSTAHVSPFKRNTSTFTFSCAWMALSS